MDLEQATELARKAVAQCGMISEIVHYDDGEARLIPAVRDAVTSLLDDMDFRAAKLVDKHLSDIVRVAEALRSRRYMTADEVSALVYATSPEAAR